MAEKSMFQQRKINSKRKPPDCEIHDLTQATDLYDAPLAEEDATDAEEHADTSDNDDDDNGPEDMPGCYGADNNTLEAGYEWAKKVDPALRCWIVTKTCRRDVADEHFGNPTPRKCKLST